MDSSLIVVDDEPQLRSWGWGPVLAYAPRDERVPLSKAFNCPVSEGAELLIRTSEDALSTLRKGAAGVFVMSDHTLRDAYLHLSDAWKSVAATVGPFTGVQVIANTKSNQAMALQSAILERLNDLKPTFA